ncbi:MAG: hypothetical protein LPH20_12085 [Shewanella sp.]|nr:hypothetical protein [Shewanella sp.]
MQTATSLITALASSRAPDLPLELLTQLNDAQIAKGPVAPCSHRMQHLCSGVVRVNCGHYKRFVDAISLPTSPSI